MRIGIEELLEVVSLWPLSARQHDEIRRVVDSERVADGAWLFRYYGSRNNKVVELEQAFAHAAGAQHAIAVNSGTSALIAALTALGIGPGDDVLVPAYTFIASASAVLIAGAVPNLVEVDETLTMDLQDMQRRITPRTRAILPVHMNGRPARMDSIVAIARERGLHVVEDVAQACGGTYDGRWLGTFGDAGCFSFGQFKSLSAGEGGMVVTNDAALATRIRSYHDTAACWRPNRYAPERTPGELFPGENYRMSELHGAVALAQLRKLPAHLAACRGFRSAVLQRLEPERMQPLAIAPDHDSRGDAAEWLVLLAPTADVAGRVYRVLVNSGVMMEGPRGRGFRDWHLYCHWEHILNRSTANRVGHPYASYPASLLNCSADACPRTLDILERSIMLNIPALAANASPRTICDAAYAAVQAALGSSISSPEREALAPQ